VTLPDRSRRVLLGLAAAGVIGTAVELASLRHWNGLLQLVPWIALGVLVLGIAQAVLRPRVDPRFVRLEAATVVVAAAFGSLEHLLANLDAGPLDFRYADRWAGMSAAARWWAAASGGVGPSPILAPLVLAQAAACLWFATSSDG
jgi:hypothetical protein